MPWAAGHPCAQPGCPLVVKGAARCPEHAAQHEAQDVARRGSATARGYDWEWRRLSKAYVRAHPLCANPTGNQACTGVAVLADHVVPHRGNDRLRLDPRNLQGLCRSCHAIKTNGEGSGHVARAIP